MPKAGSSITSGRQGRGKKLPLTGYFAPKASGSPLKSPGEKVPYEISECSGTAGLEGLAPTIGLDEKKKGYWRPQDIFDPEWNPDGSLEGKTDGGEAIETEPLVSEVSEESIGEQVIVETLDEAAIAAQLELPEAPDEVEDAAEETAHRQEKPHLRAHYLPFLFAAKAPPSDMSQCHNSTCTKTFDWKSPHLQMWRCRSCFGGKCVCTECLREAHRDQPFHIVETWVTREFALQRASDHWAGSFPGRFGFFASWSLKDAGLQVGLGHQGQLCPRTSNRDNFDMTILHVNGQHSVTFRPCACGGKEKWELLLEAGIFPATETTPQTGFTLELLDHYQEFSLRAKVSLREYYQAIVGLTNGADPKGDRGVSYIYEQLRAVVRSYRVLVMHMRAGRSNADSPMEAGELCVTCPACPQPGVNLPENWISDPLMLLTASSPAPHSIIRGRFSRSGKSPRSQLPAISQLRYARFLSGDGNFKLQKLAKRKSFKYDPKVYESMLGDGAFWARKDVFHRYLKDTPSAADEPGGRRSACNTMAGDPGRTPDSGKAVEITGVFAVSCRHVFLCKNGVVDFYYGERFRPVDVAFSGPLTDSYTSGIRHFVITYDIACKYGVNFRKRCFNDDPSKALIPTSDGEMHIAFCVNKFHQESHEEECSAKNALNYTKFVGRTCGEGVETIWAAMNHLRYSSREMTAGNREETLSEHFNDWNWQKLMGIVHFLRKSYLKAIQSLSSVKTRFQNIQVTLPADIASELEADYDAKGGEQFLDKQDELKWPSRKELAKQMEDLSLAHPSEKPAKAKNVSYSNLICKALALEEMQARLRQRAHDISRVPSPTAQMKSQVIDLREKLEEGLARHYTLLREVAPQFRESGRSLSPDLEAPQTDPILLPSRLSKAEIEALGLETLLQIEVNLRVGHACDCIKVLRRALGTQSWWTRHTNAQQSSQSRRTKGQASLRAARARVREATRAYTACYDWLVKCAPDTASRFGLQPLQQSDLVLLSDYLEQQHYKKYGNELPWIWNVRPDLDSMEVDAGLKPSQGSSLESLVESWTNEFVRLEYVHAHAAFDRWSEEVGLLRSEMPAVVRWFENQAKKWGRRADTIDEDSSGYSAYASKQFAMYVRFAEYARETFTQAVGGKENWDALMQAEEVGENEIDSNEEIEVCDDI